MKMQNLKNTKWNYPWLAFGITFTSFLVLMIIGKFAPFGDNSMLYSDSYHQYYPFFVEFRRALRSGESLLYTWSIGLGMDYLGLIAYYLASPFNLLSVILPESWLLGYFSLLVPIKLSFASLFFAIFLKHIFEQDDLSVTFFGCAYGLCAWSMAYLWNIMWLDTFALLPLVMLGMVQLLTKRKFILYTLTLFLSILTNYYIGLFTCFFVLLVFFCFEICRWGGWKKFLVDLCLMAAFSVLAIGMTAFLELPALAALQNTQSSVNSFPTSFRLNMTTEHNWKGLLDAFRKVLGNTNGGLEPSFKEGLPNLYTGLFANVLALLFMLNPNIKLRDKLCAGFLLIFFCLSFIIRQLDYIWHGFHFTNMLPYRFSFLYSFVLLYMGYRAYLEREHFALWQVLIAGILGIGLVLCSDSRTDAMYLAYNGAFILLYFFVFVSGCLHGRLPEDATERQTEVWVQATAIRRYQSRYFLLIVIALELVLTLVNFGSHFGGTSTTFYPRGKEYSASMIRYMHEREQNTLFFRAEVTNTQTLNDGALNGYNGITAFTSSANVNVTEFMKKLGYSAKNTYNRYAFEESSPVSNLFLGLKYMLERSGKVEDNPYFTALHHYGDVYLLENNAYLPLGFLTERDLVKLDFDVAAEPFVFQNKLFRAATGIDEDVFSIIPGQLLTITSSDASLSNMTADGSCSYETSGSAGQVDYRYLIDRDGFMCIHLDLSKRNKFTIWVNGEELNSKTYSLPYMFSVCQVQAGDLVEVALACGANESGTINLSAALMDDAVFNAGYNKLAASTWELTSFSNTKVTGTILCDRDGLMYTSIPQDGNWHIYVDGQEAQTYLVGDAMIGVPLTEGQHEVRFVYRNSAFTYGCLISLACAAIVLLLYFWVYPAQTKRGKYIK